MIIYMGTVVYLVKRQMKKMEMDEVQVAMTNEKGETTLKDVDKVLSDDRKLLL